MVRTGPAAQTFALGRVGGRMPHAGLCLQFTRTVFNVGPRYPSAVSAWEHATHRHTTAPPRGAVVPVFFRTPSPYRHVAVALGNGKVVSTNGAAISLWSSVEHLADAFRGPYLGWTEDIDGVRVHTGAPHRRIPVTGVWGSLTTTALQRRFGTPADGVITGQVRLRANANVASLRVGTGGSMLVVAMQRWLRTAVDGQLDGVTIRALQRRFGTTVDGTISRPSSLVEAIQRALDAPSSVLPGEGIAPAPVIPVSALPPFLPGVPGVLVPPLGVPADDGVLADGTTLPPDPIDLRLVTGDLVPDDAAADAAVPDLDVPDDADPGLDADHLLEDAPQDEEAGLDSPEPPSSDALTRA
ncbi:hypothetical protein GCM10025864_11040 [Luteimicrobium album]|uniref:Uncharacterized protein n=1 Tax=Luteimicrobium album TaxID=1054550 RepID=A0ABQ6HY64_9MICO|nr:hypothetical protein [Luteimicrobium album]GMA23345.1 hypothetical protein GCM10025864_11040 [Luteimicrobium album]